MYFICVEDNIKRKLSVLTKTTESEYDWESYYVDKNREEWLLTRYHSEYQGGGFPILKKLPRLSIEKLIEIVLHSSDVEDIKGASIELYERGKYEGEEKWELIVERLNQIRIDSIFEKERVKMIINETNLTDPLNRREIVGKHYTQIQKDAHYFQAISRTAKEILTKIESIPFYALNKSQ